MFDTFLHKLKTIIKSPMILFVWGIMSQWYVMIMVTAIIVVYWVFQGLTQIGFFSASKEIVSRALNESKSVARYCVPKILSWTDFWECLENPPDYEETKDEEILREAVEDLVDLKNYLNSKDPYDDSSDDSTLDEKDK